LPVPKFTSKLVSRKGESIEFPDGLQMLQVDIGIHDALLFISGGYHLTPGTDIDIKKNLSSGHQSLR
jgi:hypothetical protein